MQKINLKKTTKEQMLNMLETAPLAVLYYDLLEEFIRAYYDQLDKTVVEGDMTGTVAGMLGSRLYG